MFNLNTAISNFNVRRLMGNGDILLAFAVIAIVAMMVIPMPSGLLDLLLAFNIALAVTIMLVSLYIEKPLDFSVFPSMLLILTLFRLGLNISSTRLILLDGQPGNVINAFGNFVVGGNYVVGIIVFLILMIIQFVVITNGAGRVAEVAARFTLDAMPGKQMSIDADLNAGLITEEEARTERKMIGQEADFYGAMDGASKFVKGDAIAGIAIVFVNIIGGFAIGAWQRDLSLVESLQTYTLLTVGDGLVSQIPALLISTATGVIVTRTGGSEENLGNDVVHQLTSKPRALMITAGMLLSLAFVPGFPSIPFIAMGVTLGAVAYFLNRDEHAEISPEAADHIPEQITAPVAPQGEVSELLQIDMLEVEVGYGLIPLVDSNLNTSLLNRITNIRRQIALELGFILPKIRIRDNLQLPPNTYAIKLRGEEVARGSLMVGQHLAMASGPVAEPLPGEETTEPAFGLPAIWIDDALKERAEMLGYTIVDPSSVLGTHLSEVIKTYAPEILTRQHTRDLLDNLKEDYPALVDDLVPNLLSLSEVQEIFKNLLRERVSIRDLVTILETISTVAPSVKNPDLLSEATRQALARSITNTVKGPDGDLHVLTLSPRIEQILSEALGDPNHGLNLNLEPFLAQRLLEETAGSMEHLAAQGYLPVILCSAAVRLAFKRLSERGLPNLTVLSYNEIPAGLNVHAEGMVELSLQPEPEMA